LEPGIYVTRKYGDNDYEVVINPACFPRLKFSKLEMNLDYDPTQPGERQKTIYGIYDAARKARDQWLQHAVHVIYSVPQPEVRQAYRHFARSKGFYEKLARAILAHDISVSLLLEPL
jgi:hypothetical protein